MTDAHASALGAAASCCAAHMPNPKAPLRGAVVKAAARLCPTFSSGDYGSLCAFTFEEGCGRWVKARCLARGPRGMLFRWAWRAWLSQVPGRPVICNVNNTHNSTRNTRTHHRPHPLTVPGLRTRQFRLRAVAAAAAWCACYKAGDCTWTWHNAGDFMWAW